jgi:hypothetical protein
MKTLTHIGITLAVAIVLAIGFYFISQSQVAVGSVTQGNEYNATTTTSADVGTSSVKSMAGSISSIIIASTSPTTVDPIRIFDTASTTLATSSLTAILEIPTAGTTGTSYVYDVAFGKGILIDIPLDFNGHYTITYR